MNYLRISIVSVFSLSAFTVFAGTVAVQPYSANLDPIATGVWGTNYDSNVLTSTDFAANIKTDSTYTSITGAPVISYMIVWSPSYSGETPPATVTLSFGIYGNIYGPGSSSGSIKTSSGTTLLSGLGTAGSYSSLYSTTITAPITPDGGDTNATGFCVIPLDVLTSAGGATVAEKATYVPAPGILFASTLARRKAVRVYKFRNETVSIYSTAKRTRRGGVPKSG